MNDNTCMINLLVIVLAAGLLCLAIGSLFLQRRRTKKVQAYAKFIGEELYPLLTDLNNYYLDLIAESESETAEWRELRQKLSRLDDINIKLEILRYDAGIYGEDWG